MNESDVSLGDFATTHTILQAKRYFLNFTLTNANVSTISGIANLVEGCRRAKIIILNGTRFHINDVLYPRKSKRNMPSLKDIYMNGYHIETMNEGNTKCLYIISIVYGKKLLVEKLSTFSSGLYHININPI